MAAQSFYVIVGSSAGALIGLQFVVMSLLADLPVARADAQAGEAFGTPNAVQIGIVLLVSAIVSAPWHGIAMVAVLWGIVGLGGLVYVAVVARRMRSQTAYRPVFEDWLFRFLLPLTGYALLTFSACVVYSYARPAMFFVGAGALLLLFIGIHNAWDTVIYHVFVRRRRPPEAEGTHEAEPNETADR